MKEILIFCLGVLCGSLGTAFYIVSIRWGAVLEQEEKTEPHLAGKVTFIDPISQKERFEQAKGLKDLIQ